MKVIKSCGVELGKQDVVFPSKLKETYLDSLQWAKNSKSAERAVGIPSSLWSEITVAYRKLFGINKLLETLFLLGFVVGWVEGKASLSGNFARGLRKKR